MIEISIERAQKLRELIVEVKETFPVNYLQDINNIILQLDLAECDEALLISVQSYLYNYMYKRTEKEKKADFFNPKAHNNDNKLQKKYIELYNIIVVLLEMQNSNKNSRNYLRR